MATSMCRVCLVSNTRLQNIDNIHLLEMYEKLTDTKLHPERENGLPSTVCYVCHRQLQKCQRFSRVAHKSNRILQDLLLNGTELTQDMQSRGVNNLAVSSIMHIDFNPASGNNTEAIKTEQVVVKEEETCEISNLEIVEMKLENNDIEIDSNDTKLTEINDEYYKVSHNMDNMLSQGMPNSSMAVTNNVSLKIDSVTSCTKIVKEEPVFAEETNETEENNMEEMEIEISKDVSNYNDQKMKILRCSKRNKKRKIQADEEGTSDENNSQIEEEMVPQTKNEPEDTNNEVINYLSIKDKDPKVRKLKRQAITDELKNKGNFINKSKVCDDGETSLLPNKRSIRVTPSPSNYTTCKGCSGTFKKATFRRHFKKCAAISQIFYWS